MQIVTVKDIAKAFNPQLITDVFEGLKTDLTRWHDFKKSPRHATHYEHGVFELMPCSDHQYYTYKYVNGHPDNPGLDKIAIVALGMLADIKTGYPLMVCDMTLPTAIRTAVTSALAAKYLAKPDSKTVGFIGNGAQAEFQLLALSTLFNIDTVKYYDVDPKAMEKFHANFGSKFNMIACKDTREASEGVDIITTAINTKKKVQLIKYDWVKGKDIFINAMGGDCPGKTELDPEILKHSKIVVEFYPQTKHEGEIQNLDYEPEYTELWELIAGKNPGRTKDDKIIVFDSVGFGLADFSIMKVIYEKGLGSDSEILPSISNPKNLYELVK